MRAFLLWDHDGVLVDTERWYYAATREALGRLGVELDAAAHLEFGVKRRSGWDLARERGVPEETIAAARAERNRRYQELLRTEDIEIDGVHGVLAELRSRHRMAIVTTARRVDFDLIHASRSIRSHFEFVLTVEDCARPKPAPDPYLQGLERFGAQPDQALVIEDSARGLAAAVAAGVDCVIVRNDFNASEDFTGAWRIVDSVRELPRILAG